MYFCLVLQLSFTNPLKVLSREWRCSWSSADRQCSNYIWVIHNFIAHQGVAYIRGLTICWNALISSRSSYIRAGALGVGQVPWLILPNCSAAWNGITEATHEHRGFSNQQSLNSLFRLTSRKISKLCITCLLWRESTSHWWIPITKGK